MSEEDAGLKEESPSREVEEPVDQQEPKQEPEELQQQLVPTPQRNSRSPSQDPTGNSDNLVLQSVFYQGKTLKLPGTHTHIHNVVFRILKNVCALVEQLTVAFPVDWDKGKPDNATIVNLTKTFNRIAKPFASNWSGSYNTDTLKDWGERTCSQKVAMDITTYAYECAVPRPADLNTYYKSFTSETYGETNLEQMASIIDELGIGSHDVFVDLGSGIGQLVCFTAAYAKCKKSVGIELSQIPANYASELGGYFKQLMSHFGKSHGRFEHHQGDFLNPKFKKLIIEEATVIFINNFAFSPELMFRITNELLQDLKHGTRIVTTKPFGAHKKDITYRSTGDINSISDTRELTSLEYGVSWTAKQVKFWLTTMDHTKLIKYYEAERDKKRDPKSREGSDETEQAAASSHQQSPKWDEPDTDYAPPAKKPKKEKHRDRGDHNGEFTEKTPHRVKEEKEKSAKKHRKSLAKEKPEKPPKTPKEKHSSRHSETPSTHHRANAAASSSSSSSHHNQHHHVPSQPKPTAPPPNQLVHKPMQLPQEVKLEEPMSPPAMNHGGPQLDAKMMKAIHTIREYASHSSQAAAIQDAIDSVLSQGTSPAPTSGPYTGPQNLPAPIPVYPPAASAPPAPATTAPAAVVPATSSEIVAEQRHTFMIPPTDPLYNVIVSYYFDLKKYFNLAKCADGELISQLRQDIETEKGKQSELVEATTNTTSQIDELLASGVHTLKSRLDELGMHKVSDVSELLAGSKHIVTQHKGLTTNVAQMETNVAVEEHKLKIIGGPDALKFFDEAIHSQPMDIMKLSDLVISTRPSTFVAQILPEEPQPTDSKVSPSARRPRQPRQKTNGTGGKRGPSGGRKSDGGPTEDVEMEIRQFVQHALKVDNAVKEKERKARGNLIAAVAAVEAIHPKTTST